MKSQSQIIIPPDKEAAFGLSFGLAVVEALMNKETCKHSRRSHKLERVHRALLDALDCYPGQMSERFFDLAFDVFEVMQEKAMGWLFMDDDAYAAKMEGIKND